MQKVLLLQNARCISLRTGQFNKTFLSKSVTFAIQKVYNIVRKMVPSRTSTDELRPYIRTSRGWGWDVWANKSEVEKRGERSQLFVKKSS